MGVQPGTSLENSHEIKKKTVGYIPLVFLEQLRLKI